MKIDLLATNFVQLNLNIFRRNQVTFGTKGLKFYRQKIGNALPVNIKTAENLNAFKDLIKKSGIAFHATAFSALIIVVSNLRLETKGSRFESGC